MFGYVDIVVLHVAYICGIYNATGYVKKSNYLYVNIKDYENNRTIQKAFTKMCTKM